MQSLDWSCAVIVAPASVRYVPATHGEQPELPVLEANSPARHTAQLVAPTSAATLPAAQAVQEEADDAEYSPVAHEAQTLESEAPTIFDDVPAPHTAQPIDPVAGWNCPDAQLKQALAPAAENVPDEQLVHPVPPVPA